MGPNRKSARGTLHAAHEVKSEHSERQTQHSVQIRRMTPADVTRLFEIDPNFESPVYLDVVKEAEGLNVNWRLIERPFDTPFVCTDFDFDEKERRAILRR